MSWIFTYYKAWNFFFFELNEAMRKESATNTTVDPFSTHYFEIAIALVRSAHLPYPRRQRQGTYPLQLWIVGRRWIIRREGEVGRGGGGGREVNFATDHITIIMSVLMKRILASWKKKHFHYAFISKSSDCYITIIHTYINFNDVFINWYFESTADNMSSILALSYLRFTKIASRFCIIVVIPLRIMRKSSNVSFLLLSVLQLSS